MAQQKPFTWYQQGMAPGFPGMKANATADVVDSFACEGGVNPGEPVVRGTDPEHQAKKAAASEKPIGIALHIHKEPPESDAEAYFPDGYSLSILTSGDVWVTLCRKAQHNVGHFAPLALAGQRHANHIVEIMPEVGLRGYVRNAFGHLCRHYAVEWGVCHRPERGVEGKQELQNTINGELEKVWQPYAAALGKKSCELDYTVPFAGSDMMSLMFFGVMGEGSEEIFERLPLNISLSDGKVLDISDVLDVENPDLLPVLALLGAEDKVDFTKEVPNSWYYNGKNLVFCQKMKDGTGWNEAAIPASELEKFMLNKNLLKK